MSIDRADIDKAVRGAGGGFFDERLDAIIEAVWDVVRPEPVEWLASELEKAARDAIESTVDLVEVTFGARGLAVDVDGIVNEVDWRQVARNHIGGTA